MHPSTHKQAIGLNPQTIGLVAGAGLFLSTLDMGIINIALPTLLKAFNARIDGLIWVVSLYTLILSSTILFFGRLVDHFGRLNVFRYRLGLFALS